MRKFFTFFLLLTPFCIAAQEISDGAVKRESDGAFVAWDSEALQWRDIESFWLSYVQRRGGLTWGRSDTYPQYDKVKEFDTFLIDLPQGPCLMEFFHRRWRRANDVRRWDEEFNRYGGCPYVFD